MPQSQQDTIEMMRRCSSEIRELRSQVERLAPKAHAYDNMCKMLGLLPERSQGVTEDLAWLLDRKAKELELELSAAKEQAAA